MFYQLDHLGTLDYYKKEYGENFNFPPHMHECYEFITVLSGEMTVTIDSHDYLLKENECVLIFPNQIHSLTSTNCKHMLCIFSPKLVAAFSSKKNGKKPTDNKFCPDIRMIQAFDELAEDSSSYGKKGLLYLICDEFEKYAEYSEQRSDNKDLLEKIFSFIEENFSRECNLSELAKHIGYDYSYLSRYFKNKVGLSFNTYVNMYRLNNACYLIKNTNDSILNCALESGFTSLRSFNRNFKKQFGVTPTEYQKELKN